MKKLIGALLPQSLLDSIRESKFYSGRVAQRLGSGDKRIDVCSAQIAHVLHLAGIKSLEGKVCLEVGAGWVLTHALAFHLLGAKKVIVTDIGPFARPEILETALKSSVPYIARDVLSPFCDHYEIRQRYNRLLNLPSYDFATLQELGIEYIAPIDFAKQNLGQPVDFIYSISVLEHVPCNDVEPLLANLCKDLVDGGEMIHAIHMEDHRDSNNAPFAFYSEPAEQYQAVQQTERGNRVRNSTWLEYFKQLPGTQSEVLYNFKRPDAVVPEQLDPSIAYVDEQDLRTGHLGIYTRKTQA